MSTLFQPLGISPTLVIKSLIKKTGDQLLLSRAQHVDSQPNTSSESINDIGKSIKHIHELFLTIQPESQQDRSTIAVDIVRDVCSVYITGIDGSTGGGELSQEVGVAIAVAEVFASVAEYVSDDVCMSVIDTVLKYTTTDSSVSGSAETAQDDNPCIQLVAVPFLVALFTQAPQLLSRLFAKQAGYDTNILSSLLSAFKDCSISIACQISGQLLPSLIEASPTPCELADKVWEFVCRVWRGQTSVSTSKMDLSLTILCCLHHLYINPSSRFFSNNGDHDVASSQESLLVDLRLNESFWTIVQESLADSDPLSRKRGMFLLHKALSSVSLLSIGNSETNVVGGASSGCSEEGVFWWGCVSDKEHLETRAVWEGVVLLLETLEEKQVHIVKPVIMKQLSVLIAATKRTVDAGHSMLHISWVGVILSRVYAHDARTIVKLGTSTCLEMNLEQSPLLQRKNWEVIFNPLISVLRNAYIFAREDHGSHDTSCSIIAQLLTGFIQRIIDHLPTAEREPFFSYLLNALSSRDIPDIPSVFISYALSCVTVPPSESYLISRTSLKAMRTLITTTFTHSISLRSATQSFLLKCFCDHFDAGLYVVEFFQTLSYFNSRECLVFSSLSWTMASDCLIRIISNSSEDGKTTCKLFQFLQAGVSQITTSRADSHSGTHSNISILSLSILLTVTAAMRSSPTANNHLLDKGVSLEEVVTSLLHPLMETITGARTRPYINHTHLVASIDLLKLIIQSLLDGNDLLTHHDKSTATQNVTQLFYSVLLPWLPDTLQFLFDAVLSGTGLSDDGLLEPALDRTKLYRDCLDCVYCFMDRYGYQWNQTRDFNLYSMLEKALEVAIVDIETPTVLLTPTVLGSITTLEWVCGHLQQQNNTDGGMVELIKSMAMLPVNLTFIKPPSSKGEAPVGVEYGPIIDYCLMNYWKCILFFIKNTTLHVPRTSSLSNGDNCSLIRVGSGSSPQVLASACLDYIDIVTKDFATPLYFLAHLIPQLSVPFVVTTISSIWPLIKGASHDLRQLLESLGAFFNVVFHSHLLLSENSAILELHIEIITEVIEMAEGKVGVFNVLVGHLISQWKSLLSDGCYDDRVIKSIENRKMVLIEGIGFGPIYRKNLRIISDIEDFLCSLDDRCSSNFIKLKQSVTDGNVRVQVLCLILELRAGKQGQQLLLTQQLLSGIILELISMLNKLSENRPKYYINSFTHRYRLRLMQVLLSLYSFTTVETSKTIVATLWACLEKDNQLSVRYSMEWLIVLLYYRYPSMWEDTLVSQLSMDGSGRRLSRLCSVFTVAMHYGKCLDCNSDKVKYYSKVLPLLFQWCLCYHFIVRLYAVGSVLAMWEEASELLKGLPEFALFPNYVNFITNYSDLVKSKKLKMNIFFTHFHPLQDYSIQAIYHLLPAVSGVLQEEWITLNMFLEQSSSFKAECFIDIPIASSNKVLLSLLEINENKMATDQEVTVEMFDPNELIDDVHDTATGDVQKKITPWSNSREILGELFPGIHPVNERNCHHHKGLVLVASLLSKAPNLGGLCRTCEIFGTSEVVLSSRNIVEEKEFKSLSVTAEKWINITEVKPVHLAEYLLLMKKKRYRIVGVEQTAHSVNLQSFKFPSMTVLLLGNERQGIPVELIHLLDDCVEIPQLGLVRSLNVHVSGALVIWEYSKQHLIQ